MKRKLINWGRIFTTLLLTFCVTVQPSVAWGLASGSSSSKTEDLITTEKHTQAEIVKYVQEHPSGSIYFDADGKLTGEVHTTEYAEEPVLTVPYSPGKLSDNELSAALNTIKTIRYIAGISDNIYLSDDYSNLAQASCIVNYANNKLTHTPSAPVGMAADLARKGYTGSRFSNIAWTRWQENSLKWTILQGWMDDSDANNLNTLGHRRWILNPSMGMTGFGSVTGENGTYTAMYTYDKSNLDNNVTGVCWPAANTPTSYFTSTSPWSISTGEEVKADDITIAMIRIRDSKIWTFNTYRADGDFAVENSSYGQKGCIIFRPKNVGEYLPGDTFIVTIAGLSAPVSYQVKFFDLERFYSPSAPVLDSISLNELGKPRLEWNTTSDAQTYNLYRKAGNGSWKLICADLDEPFYEDAVTGPGITYHYRITACREVGGTSYESFESEEKKITTTLRAPSWTSAKAVSSKKNTLKWKKSYKASGYKIYRRKKATASSAASSWKLIKTTSALTCTDTSAKSKVRYEYRIRAYRKYNGSTVFSRYTAAKTVQTK